MRKHAVKKARSMFRLFVLKVAEVESKWNEVVLEFNANDPNEAKKVECVRAELDRLDFISHYCPAPLQSGHVKQLFSKYGTAIFNTWTAEEETENMDALRDMFKHLELPFTVSTLSRELAAQSA